MDVSLNTLLIIGVGLLTGLLGWTVNSQKKVLENALQELKTEIAKTQGMLGNYMTKELCDAEHRAHKEKHVKGDADINGVGSRVNSIEKRVHELEKKVG